MKRTSVMDVPSYRQCCAKCAQDPTAFKTFRQEYEIVSGIDTVHGEYGRDYFKRIYKSSPYLLKHLAEFAKNDLVGCPNLCAYPEIGGAICPTTLRYIKTLGDLINLFGPMDGWRIVEIGGGYGGFSRILSCFTKLANYSIIDLPETLALAKKYHEQFGLTQIEYLNAEQPVKMGSFDLFLSNYAFSECCREVQNAYLDNVLRYSKHGYMIVNVNHRSYGIDANTSAELQTTLESFGCEVFVQTEDPLPNPSVENLQFSWKRHR